MDHTAVYANVYAVESLKLRCARHTVRHKIWGVHTVRVDFSNNERVGADVFFFVSRFSKKVDQMQLDSKCEGDTLGNHTEGLLSEKY